MTITAGIDVGSGAVKAVIMEIAGGDEGLLAHSVARIRRRDVPKVVDEVFHAAAGEAGIDSIDYVATTGEGEDIDFATGHFYGMTTHARGGLFLEPRARSILDVGALHGRAVAMDARGKVLDYKMTSQCASGSGQFLENIGRYLGVAQAEIGPLSLQASRPERVSSVCAVLAETDVINMVSRGIETTDILRGIHESMAGRYARLLRSIHAGGLTLMTGGLAQDEGLLAALRDALVGGKKKAPPLDVVGHPQSIFAGAIGAAIWGAFRHQRLELAGAAWTSRSTTSSAAV
jgi:benzoyl-CoA reductase subunit D